jgi:hypothetical protein
MPRGIVRVSHRRREMSGLVAEVRPAREWGQGEGCFTPSPASSAKNDPNAEVTAQDSGTTFRLRVNLVQVHVAVRDTNDNPVASLKQEDFQLFDQGKLQPKIRWK